MNIRESLRHARVRLGLSALMCACACSIAHGDTITLKTAARQQASATSITLGDIATLDGAEAQRLAGVQVGAIKPEGRPIEITVADVRKALNAAGANWAQINLSGRSVLVRPSREAGMLPPQAMTAVALDGAAMPSDAAVTPQEQSLTLDNVMHQPTVAGMIANLIVSSLHVSPCDVRIRMRPQDAALLATSTASARYEIQPMGSLSGDRLAFAVRRWSGDSAQQVGQVSLNAERLTPVTHLRRDVPRDAIVLDADVETETKWLSPSEAAQVAEHASVVGRTLVRSLKTGDVVRGRDLSREALIKRGELVIVRCLVGGVAISLQAEAKGEGGEGDTIEFRKSGERETFLATVTGSGQAVVNLAKQ